MREEVVLKEVVMAEAEAEENRQKNSFDSLQ